VNEPRIGLAPSRTIETAAAEAARVLVVVAGAPFGTTIPVKDEPLLVGRSSKATFLIDADDVSGLHAKFTRDAAGDVWVEDLGSRNGTWVNGERIAGRTPLAVGDVARLGRTVAFKLGAHDPVDDELRERQRMDIVGRLALALVHDFNNMLAVAVSNVDYVRSLPPSARADPEVEKSLEETMVSLARAAELCKRLLATTRCEEQMQDALDLSRLFHDTGRLVRRALPRQIVVELDAEERLYVRGDSVSLEQALMNLCVNARDAMPQGGALRLSLGRGPSDDVVLRVSDSGHGMDDATRKRVFEPFFTTKRAGGGFGLGLATVAEVVSRHGGSIDVESEVGRGTTFTIRMPRVTERAFATNETPTSEGDRPALEPATVLLVDDEPAVRRSLRRILVYARFGVVEASDGAEAIELFARAMPRPTAALVDLDMPGLAGGETCRRLRALDPSLAILVVTGVCDVEAERELLDAGVRRVLRKPLGAGELVEALGEALSPSASRA
jgi:signal transduction histidine kinase/CheY-like chemotaxis protein